jgi:uncharacterized delta-60 repeat protein
VVRGSRFAAAVAGCGGGGNISTAHVTRGQLALMPLTRSTLGPVATSLTSGVSGVETNARYASDSVDPNVTAASLAKEGRLTGRYRIAAVADRRTAAVLAAHGLLGIDTEVDLYRDPGAAARALTARDRELHGLVGRRLKGGRALLSVSGFGPGSIGDRTLGRRFETREGKYHLYYTRVEFLDGRLFATTYELRAGPQNEDTEVTSLAQALQKRIAGVIDGTIRAGAGLVTNNSAGRLDGDFGRKGLVSTSFHGNFGDEANAVLVQPDGKIVAVGRGDGHTSYAFVVARYDANGALDTGFGDAGLVRTTFGTHGDSDGYAAVLQPDGKIVVAGDHEAGRRFEFALARYEPDGSLDPAFGAGGRVATSFGATASAQATAMALQPDGKIVVAGSAKTGVTTEIALARYDSDGRPDGAFGLDGRVLTAIAPASRDAAMALALQQDGEIVVAGSHRHGNAMSFAHARYDSRGRLDPSFGHRGTLTTPVGGPSFASALVIQSNGDLLAGGLGSSVAVSLGFALACYQPDGRLDHGFGRNGLVVTGFPGGGLPSVSGLAIQPDGKIVAAGSADLGTEGFLLARYDQDGGLDGTFGRGGKASTTFPRSSEDDLNAVALQPDGKIVAAGATAPDDRGYRFALARYDG